MRSPQVMIEDVGAEHRDGRGYERGKRLQARTLLATESELDYRH